MLLLFFFPVYVNAVASTRHAGKDATLDGKILAEPARGSWRRGNTSWHSVAQRLEREAKKRKGGVMHGAVTACNQLPRSDSDFSDKGNHFCVGNQKSKHYHGTLSNSDFLSGLQIK